MAQVPEEEEAAAGLDIEGEQQQAMRLPKQAPDRARA
jgi:hypothetical protein